IGADLVDPLWTAKFRTPAEFRAEEQDALRLLEARVLDGETSGKLIDLLERDLPTAVGDGAALRLVGTEAGIPPSPWDVAQPVPDRVNGLLARALEVRRLPQLVDAVHIHLPGVLSAELGLNPATASA